MTEMDQRRFYDILIRLRTTVHDRNNVALLQKYDETRCEFKRSNVHALYQCDRLQVEWNASRSRFRYGTGTAIRNWQ